MSQKLLRMCSLLLLFAFPASVMASDAVGILSGTGDVSVQGEPAASSAAVFAGDMIQTGDSGHAALHDGHGLSISIGPDSKVQVHPGALDLSSGAIVVTGSNAALRVNGVRIVSQSTVGKFLVQDEGNGLNVVALAGNLVVGEGQDQTTVPATKGVNVGKGNGKDQTNDQTTNQTGSTAGRARWLSNPDIGILVVVAAAVTAGVALGIVNAENRKSPSPSVP